MSLYSDMFWFNHSPYPGRIEGTFCSFESRLAKLSLAVLFIHSCSSSFWNLLSFLHAYFRDLFCKTWPPLVWTAYWTVKMGSAEYIFKKGFCKKVRCYFQFYCIFWIFLQRLTFQICFQGSYWKNNLFMVTFFLFDLKHLTSCSGVCPVFTGTYAAIYLMTQWSVLSFPLQWILACRR